MGADIEISACTPRDCRQILEDLPQFWDGRDVAHLHHPLLIHEFGNSAFVIRSDGGIAAYLFGFISQTEPVGYVHAIAVRAAARRQGFAEALFDHFVAFARRRGCSHVKAITTPTNAGSIAFHKSLGMTLLGAPNADGVPVVADYAGRGNARVVFWKSI
jgi:GNAT superfamily N-acetyltransferase